MEDFKSYHGSSSEVRPKRYACMFALHNYCEKHKISVDSKVVEDVMIEERRIVDKIDKLNSYTTTAGGKVRDTLTDYFKEFM